MTGIQKLTTASAAASPGFARFLRAGRTALRWLAPLLALFAAALPARADEPAVSEPWLDELTFQLTGHYAVDGELTIEWARPRPAEAAAPATLEVLNFPAALTSQLLLRVRATTAAGAAELTLVLRAQLWREGLATREPTERGSRVEAPSLEPQRFDALRDRDAIPAGGELDLVYARAVPAGRLLTWRDVARRPLVRRGQLIEVAATSGPLTVTLRALALADAGRGELVRLRNPDSRKEFSAQVVGDARAQIVF